MSQFKLKQVTQPYTPQCIPVLNNEKKRRKKERERDREREQIVEQNNCSQ